MAGSGMGVISEALRSAEADWSVNEKATRLCLKDHQARYYSAADRTGTQFRASAHVMWVTCRISKLAGGVQPRHPPASSLLPQRFSGRHFLELMVDFATNRSEKFVKFVLYR